MNNKRNFKILGRQNYVCQESPTDIGSLFHGFRRDDFKLDPYYQRDFVWDENAQREYLNALFSGKPVGAVTIISDRGKDLQWKEVVDGRQRLTTLRRFYNNEIDINGYFYKDLCDREKRFLERTRFLLIELRGNYDDDVVSEKTKLQYFWDINFGGVPQSEEHKNKIKEMINEHQ